MTANCIKADPAVGQSAAPGPRRCLCCGSGFPSAGRHEWVCPRCKESEIWQAALSEYAVQAEPHSRGEAD